MLGKAGSGRDLDLEGRQWAALIHMNINGAMVQVYYVNICLH